MTGGCAGVDAGGYVGEDGRVARCRAGRGRDLGDCGAGVSYDTVAQLRRRALEEWTSFEHWKMVVDDAEARALGHFKDKGVPTEIQRVGEVAALASKDFEFQRAVNNRNNHRAQAEMYANLALMEMQYLALDVGGVLQDARDRTVSQRLKQALLRGGPTRKANG